MQDFLRYLFVPLSLVKIHYHPKYFLFVVCFCPVRLPLLDSLIDNIHSTYRDSSTGSLLSRLTPPRYSAPPNLPLPLPKVRLPFSYIFPGFHRYAYHTLWLDTDLYIQDIKTGLRLFLLLNYISLRRDLLSRTLSRESYSDCRYLVQSPVLRILEGSLLFSGLLRTTEPYSQPLYHGT